MCIMAVIAVAQAAVSFAAASAEYSAQSAQWQQNYVNAIKAGAEDQKQIQLRTMQEQDAFAQKMHLANLEGAEVSAEAEVSAGEAGVAGISTTNILNGINRKIVAKQEAERTNYQNVAAQLGQELKATTTQIQNRINSVQRPVSPNPLGYALEGLGGALKYMS